MTYDDLFELAQRRALVRWFPSGIVEKLRATKDDRIISRRFKTSLMHHVQRHAGDYHCVEISRPEALAAIGWSHWQGAL